MFANFFISSSSLSAASLSAFSLAALSACIPPPPFCCKGYLGFIYFFRLRFVLLHQTFSDSLYHLKAWTVQTFHVISAYVLQNRLAGLSPDLLPLLSEHIFFFTILHDRAHLYMVSATGSCGKYFCLHEPFPCPAPLKCQTFVFILHYILYVSCRLYKKVYQVLSFPCLTFRHICHFSAYCQLYWLMFFLSCCQNTYL